MTIGQRVFCYWSSVGFGSQRFPFQQVLDFSSSGFHCRRSTPAALADSRFDFSSRLPLSPAFPLPAPVSLSKTFAFGRLAGFPGQSIVRRRAVASTSGSREDVVDHLAKKSVHGDVASGLRLSPELGARRDQDGEQRHGEQQVADATTGPTALRARVHQQRVEHLVPSRLHWQRIHHAHV